MWENLAVFEWEACFSSQKLKATGTGDCNIRF